MYLFFSGVGRKVFDKGNIHYNGPPPFNDPSNAFARINIIKSKRYSKNRYIGNFMYTTFCILYSALCSAST